MTALRRQFVYSLLMIITVVLAGTLGYVLLENWPVFDALYMTVTTITTVDFREVHPLSGRGMTFTIFLIVSGVGTILLCAE